VQDLLFIGRRIIFYPGVTKLTPNHTSIIRAEIAIVKAKKGFIPNQSIHIRFAGDLVNGTPVLSFFFFPTDWTLFNVDGSVK
jgi:hypothetical protein